MHVARRMFNVKNTIPFRYNMVYKKVIAVLNYVAIQFIILFSILDFFNSNKIVHPENFTLPIPIVIRL